MYLDRFTDYFAREVAEKAAGPLGSSAEIEFQVSSEPAPETFTFYRKGGKNAIRPGHAESPQLVFTLTAAAADEILAETSTEIGTIGVGILKLMASPDANRRVKVKLRVGVMSLWSGGYFGVIAAGGTQFASYLASKGLGGLGAIKEALKNLRS